MESISVFDMLKIGVGPSSSHTLGPWRAGERWIKELKESKKFDLVEGVTINLYGSLSLTGKGHATDLASVLGLLGYDPVTIPVENIDPEINNIKTFHRLNLNGERSIDFNLENDIVFHKKFLAVPSKRNEIHGQTYLTEKPPPLPSTPSVADL